MVDLIATKSLRYNTRRLLPDEPFQASPRYARILVAIGKARLPAADVERAPEDINDVRADYERALGRRPFNGWDIPTLREKIAASTRD